MIIITVIRNRMAVANAEFLNRFLLMSIFVLPYCGEMYSEVMSRMMLMTASQRLTSHKDRGKIMI